MRLGPTVGQAQPSAADIVKLLNGMPFYSGKGAVSSTPHNVDGTGLNAERHRRFARTQSADGAHACHCRLPRLDKGAGQSPSPSSC